MSQVGCRREFTGEPFVGGCRVSKQPSRTFSKFKTAHNAIRNCDRHYELDFKDVKEQEQGKRGFRPLRRDRTMCSRYKVFLHSEIRAYHRKESARKTGIANSPE